MSTMSDPRFRILRAQRLTHDLNTFHIVKGQICAKTFPCSPSFQMDWVEISIAWLWITKFNCEIEITKSALVARNHRDLSRFFRHILTSCFGSKFTSATEGRRFYWLIYDSRWQNEITVCVCEVFKIQGLVCKRFLPSPPPLPSFTRSIFRTVILCSWTPQKRLPCRQQSAQSVWIVRCPCGPLSTVCRLYIACH